MRLFPTLLLAGFLSLLSACGTPYATAENRLEEPVMLLGYDPTSYFTKGAPERGKPEFKLTMSFRTYYFASAESKALFLRTPWLFEPQYGGFSATGAAYGMKLGSDPGAWQISNGRLFIFGDQTDKSVWLLDPKWHVDHADRQWLAMRASGWRAQTLLRYADRAPNYKSDAQVTQELQQKRPGMVWPSSEAAGISKNLLSPKPPGWRAAEGLDGPALGYPE